MDYKFRDWFGFAHNNTAAVTVEALPYGSTINMLGFSSAFLYVALVGVVYNQDFAFGVLPTTPGTLTALTGTSIHRVFVEVL